MLHDIDPQRVAVSRKERWGAKADRIKNIYAPCSTRASGGLGVRRAQRARDLPPSCLPSSLDVFTLREGNPRRVRFPRGRTMLALFSPPFIQAGQRSHQSAFISWHLLVDSRSRVDSNMKTSSGYLFLLLFAHEFPSLNWYAWTNMDV